MRRVLLLAALAALAACRGSGAAGDARTGDALDADIPPVTQVALGVFGVPGPENGIEDPVMFIGCPDASGSAAIELMYLQTDNSVADDGAHFAQFTRTVGSGGSGSGSDIHDHIAIGSDLVIDLDEQGADPGDAPFVYPTEVTAVQTYYDTNAHTFATHVLNPAMPSMNSLGAWNTDVLVTCP